MDALDLKLEFNLFMKMWPEIQTGINVSLDKIITLINISFGNLNVMGTLFSALHRYFILYT